MGRGRDSNSLLLFQVETTHPGFNYLRVLAEDIPRAMEATQELWEEQKCRPGRGGYYGEMEIEGVSQIEGIDNIDLILAKKGG